MQQSSTNILITLISIINIHTDNVNEIDYCVQQQVDGSGLRVLSPCTLRRAFQRSNR